jgi:SAM-dependent methyltransferase
MRTAVAVLCVALLAGGCAHAPTSGEVAPRADDAGPDVPFVPTPAEVVEEMLRLAAVRAGDVVYDLGCGDGRIVIAAAKEHGVRGVGVDIDPALVAEAQRAAASAGVAHLVEFRRADLFDTDLREATVVTLYLGPALNLKLRPKLLRELRPGARIVSHNFPIGDWKPARESRVGWHAAYLWSVPETVPPELLGTSAAEEERATATPY